MATRDLTYLISFDTDSRDLGRAADDVEDLVDSLEDLDRERVVLDIEDSDVERTASDVMELQEELERFNREQFIVDMEIDLEESQARLRELADQLQELEEFDLPGVREEVLSEYAEVEQRVEGLKQDLDDLGVPRNIELGGAGQVEQVGQSARGAADGLDRVSRSGDQSRQVLANMTGNAAQDLAELGGVAGTAGVAVSQLVEYAVDGNISLRNFARVVGPMAAVGVAAAGISKVLGEIAETRAWRREQVEGFAEAIEDVGDGVQAVSQYLTEIGRLDFSGPSQGLLGPLLQDTEDLVPKLGEIGVTIGEVASVIAGTPDDVRAFSQELIGLTRDAGDAEEIQRGLLAVQENYQRALEESGGAQEFFRRGVEEWNTVLQSAVQDGLEPAARYGEDWAIVMDDVADGTIDTAEAQNALNRMMAEMGTINPADVIEVVADAMTEQKDAARESAEATQEWIEANRNFDPSDLRWALVRDAANGLREGIPMTITQVQALQSVMDEFNLSTAEALDIGIGMWDDYQAQIEETAEAERQAAEDAAEAERERVEALRELQNAADDVGRSIREVADRGDAMSGVLSAFRQLGELGQTQELIGFVDGLNGVVDAINALDSSDLSGLDLVPESWDEVLNMPEELGGVVSALSTFAGEVQREMAQAFDTGGEQGVREWAENTRNAIINALPDDVTPEQVREILAALGLLPEQVEIAIIVSNQERARAALDGMASLIAGLPEETQLRVTAAADQDPIEALRLVLDGLAAEGVEIPAEIVAVFDELSGDIEGYEPPPVVVTPTVTAEGVEGAIGDMQATADENPVTVAAEADTDDAVAQLDDAAEERTSRFKIDLWNIIVQNALLNKVAEDRTAKITAQAHTFAAENALDAVAADRTATVNVDAVLRNFPTRQQIIDRMTAGQGYIRIPVDTYARNVARVSGPRAI